MKALLSLVAVLSLSNPAGAEGQGAPAAIAPPRAEIHFVSWETLTSSALTTDSIRANPDVAAVIRDAGLISKLRMEVDALECSLAAPSVRVADLRLVIDFRSGDGRTETVAMNKVVLYDARGRTCKVSERLMASLNLFASARPANANSIDSSFLSREWLSPNGGCERPID